MTLVIIPSRLGSTRLPRKPLQHIAGKTIIQHVVDRCRGAGWVPLVATDSQEICNAVDCNSIITPSELRSGSDRVAYAANVVDPSRWHKVVVNVQGDMPFIDPHHLAKFIECAERLPAGGLLTACAVQHYVSLSPFRRKSVMQHIGLYAYTRDMLDEFSAAEPSQAEIDESLEQNRFEGVRAWSFIELPRMPMEINTEADLAEAQRLWGT